MTFLPCAVHPVLHSLHFVLMSIFSNWCLPLRWIILPDKAINKVRSMEGTWRLRIKERHFQGRNQIWAVRELLSSHNIFIQCLYDSRLSETVMGCPCSQDCCQTLWSFLEIHCFLLRTILHLCISRLLFLGQEGYVHSKFIEMNLWLYFRWLTFLTREWERPSFSPYLI